MPDVIREMMQQGHSMDYIRSHVFGVEDGWVPDSDSENYWNVFSDDIFSGPSSNYITNEDGSIDFQDDFFTMPEKKVVKKDGKKLNLPLSTDIESIAKLEEELRNSTGKWRHTLQQSDDIGEDESIFDYLGRHGYQADRIKDGQEIWTQFGIQAPKEYGSREYEREFGINRDERNRPTAYSNNLSFEEYADQYGLDITSKKIQHSDAEGNIIGLSTEQNRLNKLVDQGLANIGRVAYGEDADKIDTEFQTGFEDTKENLLVNNLLSTILSSMGDLTPGGDLIEGVSSLFGTAQLNNENLWEKADIEKRNQGIKFYLGEEKGQSFIDSLDAVGPSGEGSWLLEGAPGVTPFQEIIQGPEGGFAPQGLVGVEDILGRGEKIKELLGNLDIDVNDLNLDQQKILGEQYRNNQVVKWFTNNTGLGGDLKHIISGPGTIDDEGIRKDNPMNQFSEGVRYMNPEMERIFIENNKTQAEYEQWMLQNPGMKGANIKLWPGESVTVNGRTFTMQKYVDDGERDKWLESSSAIVNSAWEREIAKLDLLNGKANPYYDRLAKNDEKLFFVESNFFEGGQGNVATNRLATEEKIAGIYAEREEIIEELNNDGFQTELNNQINIIKGLEEVTDAYMTIAENTGSELAAENFARLNYQHAAKLGFSLSNTIGKMIYFAGDLGLWGTSHGPFMPDDKWAELQNQWLDTWDMSEEQAKLAPVVKWSEQTDAGNWGENYANWIAGTTMQAAPTLAMVIGPSKFARMRAAKNAKRQWIGAPIHRKSPAYKAGIEYNTLAKELKKATNQTTAMFTVSSAGEKLHQLNTDYKNAEEQVGFIQEQLQNTNDPKVKEELEEQLEYYESFNDTTRFNRMVDAVSYGLIDGFSEKFGTLSWFNKARRFTKFKDRKMLKGEKWRAALQRNMVAAGKSILKGGGIVGLEVFEEFLAQFGHNAVDKYMGAEIFGTGIYMPGKGGQGKKSLFHGMDSDLLADTMVSLSWLMGPGAVSNITRSIRAEISTSKEKKQWAKDNLEIRQIEHALRDPGLSRADRKLLLQNQSEILERAVASDFMSRQRWASMPIEDRMRYMELSDQKAAAVSYNQELTLNPEFALGIIKKDKDALGQLKKSEAGIAAIQTQLDSLVNTKALKQDTKARKEISEKLGFKGQVQPREVADGRRNMFDMSMIFGKAHAGNMMQEMGIEDIGKWYKANQENIC